MPPLVHYVVSYSEMFVGLTGYVQFKPAPPPLMKCLEHISPRLMCAAPDRWRWPRWTRVKGIIFAVNRVPDQEARIHHAIWILFLHLPDYELTHVLVVGWGLGQWRSKEITTI